MSAGATALPSAQRHDKRTAERRRRAVNWAQQNGVVFALILLCAFFALQSDRFLTRGNINIILLQVAVTGVIAVPAAMLLLAGYVDLSVGSVMVLAAAVFGQMVESGAAEAWAALCALAIGAGWGLANGFFISVLGFSSIVVTLGGLAAARGVAQLLSDALTVSGFSEGFVRIGSGRVFDTPVPILIAAGVFAIGFYVWNVSATGRHLAAVGSDEIAARAMGVRTRRLPFILYGFSGLAAALGGLIMTARLNGASMSIGQAEELAVLTAVLLGGVSFKGGRGSLVGVLAGLLFLGALRNGLILLRISSFWQQVAVGAALFFAAGLDVLYQRLERLALERSSDGEASEEPG